MKVSITGTLEGMSRKDAAELIESKTDAAFSPHVTYDTNYLVATRFDSGKARRAAKIGVDIISQAEMMEFIEAGSFPPNKTPGLPKRPTNYPEIKWVEEFDDDAVAYLEYADVDGVVTERYVRLTARGVGNNGVEYLGGYDGAKFKTFRTDRVLRTMKL